MKYHKITLEHILYLLAFSLALGYRSISLGQDMLSDSEASLALQALDIATGKSGVVGSQTLYVLLTSILFFLFGSGEYLARFWPAISGSLIVFTPYLFKNWFAQANQRITTISALLLAFLLAVDPGLVAASRMADGRIMAVSFMILAAGFFYQRNFTWGGICAGLALLTGPFLWPGLFGLLVTLFWSGILTRPRVPAPAAAEPLNASKFKALVAWIAGTILFVGSMFFIVPTGLSGMTYSLPDYIFGWGRLSAIPAFQLVIGLLVYQPLALVLGLSAIAWNWHRKDHIDAFLWKWWLVALVLAIVYPNRQVADLLWCLIPLWTLAARQLVRLARPVPGETASLLGQTTLSVLLLLFARFNIIGSTNATISASGFLANPSVEPTLRWFAVIGAISLLLLIALLVAWGWSSRVAGTGLAWGACIILAVYTLSGSWNAAGLGRGPEASLWRTAPYPVEGKQLMNTIGDVSRWRTGRPEVLDLTVVNINSPGLRWALRNEREVNYVSFLQPTVRPSMVITTEQAQLSLSANYSGQDFTWGQSPAWASISPPGWLSWAAFRESPVERQNIILWVRTDLFPGAAKTLQGQTE